MELNFLFGNPIKGKKGGKRMAGKKRRAAKAKAAVKKPKARRKRSAKRNPIIAGGSIGTVTSGRGKAATSKKALMTKASGIEELLRPAQIYLKPVEKARLAKVLKNKIKNVGRAAVPLTQAQISALTAAGVNVGRITQAADKTEQLKTARKALVKLRTGATGAEAKYITEQIREVDDKIADLGYMDINLSPAEKKSRYKRLLDNLSRFDESHIVGDGWEQSDLNSQQTWSTADLEDDDNLQFLLDSLSSKKAGISKAEIAKAILSAPASTQGKLVDLYKKMKNPYRKGRKSAMAKKRAKKAHGKKRKVGAKAAPRKHKKRKSRKTAVAAIMKALSSGKKRSKKRRGHKRSHKRRNPVGLMGFLREQGSALKESPVQTGLKVLAAGAAAALVVGVIGPRVQKFLPKVSYKIGGVDVAGLAIGAAIPAALIAAVKMTKLKDKPMLDLAANVMAVVTLANIGSRLLSGVMPMAGVEPTLMGVEPQLMGSADFGDADFGAIEQFSGVEPQLMGSYGSADFGAIEQFSGHDAASLGAIQLHGDEDYAGDDFDGDDMDGDSDFGLG